MLALYPILHSLNGGQKSSHLCQACAYSKHHIHHSVVTEVMDHLSHLPFLRCEVFKGHDPGLSRLQEVACTWRKTQQSPSNITHNAQMRPTLYFYIHNMKQQLWANFYKLSCGLAVLSHYLPLLSLCTKLTFIVFATSAANTAISSSKLDLLEGIGPCRQNHKKVSYTLSK